MESDIEVHYISHGTKYIGILGPRAHGGPHPKLHEVQVLPYELNMRIKIPECYHLMSFYLLVRRSNL